MKNSMCAWKRALAACFVFVLTASVIHAQPFPPVPPPIPADTSHYLVTLATGKQMWERRPPDTMMVPSELVIRFRPGALDSNKLSQTYWQYFYGHSAKRKDAQPLSGGGPYDGLNQPRGFYPALRSMLFADQFWFDSTDNIVKDTSLRNFLISEGGHFLHRFTAASPLDTLTITRLGDTVPSDLPCYMVLNFDSTVNPLYLAYMLTWEFPHDIAEAIPSYKGGNLDGQPSDLYYTLGYQRGIRMIQADTAWNHETGDTSISVEVLDGGLDWRHPDFGDSVVGTGHKWMAIWNYGRYPNDIYVDSTPEDHGTAMSGIIGALSNNKIGSKSPFDTSVAGIAGGHGTLLPDSESMGRGVTLAGYEYDLSNDFTWAQAVFESASRSPNTPFGLGVNIVNASEGWSAGYYDPSENVVAAVNYAYLNGVTFVASKSEQALVGDSSVWNFPSDIPDDPWLISVGGSTDETYREKIAQSDFGHTLDLIAPAGASDAGSDPYVLNYTTSKPSPTSPFTYEPYGGTSSSAANVSGSAALLLSHYVHSDYGDTAYDHLEPEDIQNILKASAWREDTQRVADTSLRHSWVPHNGYGHLDIGHAFQMLDTDENAAPDAGYHLYHVTKIGTTRLDTGAWGSFVDAFQFRPPWEDIGFSDTFSVGITHLLAENLLYGYRTRVRKLTFSYILPNTLENSDTCPIFVWGRSGGSGNPTGWSFANPNFETGWTKVTNGLGSDPDSMMDGIFASNRVISVETGQYDVWGWSDATNSYSVSLGHCPTDSEVAVNFSYLARLKKPSSGVRSAPNLASNSLEVLLDPVANSASVSYNLTTPLHNARIEIYDALGRLVAWLPRVSANIGWNETPLPVSALTNGVYFCRLSGENYSLSKTFTIVK